MQDEPDIDPAVEASRYRPIKKLDESVVNRIAAGEIIHRPANALKELIENSLDAGATMIRITLKDGGVKLLQIQDNGSGIRHTDLPLLCERFATSKLRDFSDLSKMTTFGFRGEALASISYVSASMSVVSKTKEQDCAYRAFYASGALAPPKPGQSSAPKQCAGTDGTLISAEDLFYNVPQRRRALRSGAEEYNRALDVAAKYAVHYGGRGIGFTCRKAGSNMTDLNTPSSPNNTTLDTIRLLHGTAVARELVELADLDNDGLGFKCRGWISGANWSSKRTTMLCFINNRLVDCPLLKRALEALYSTLLPKGGHPWIYVSLEIKPENVDVNVHPTKKEVHFLDEEEIVDAICSHVQNSLAGANSSRTFQFSQALLPGASVPSEPRRTKGADVARAQDDEGDETPYDDERRDLLDAAPGTTAASNARASTNLPPSLQKGYPQHMVRVDARSRTLDSMISAAQGDASQKVGVRSEAKKRVMDPLPSNDSLTGIGEDETASRQNRSSSIPRTRKRARIQDSGVELTSIKELRAEIQKQKHGGLTDIAQNHTFVGVVDLDKSLSLVQHETRLYLVGHAAFMRSDWYLPPITIHQSEELAYQLVIRQFGSLQRIRLDPAPSLEALVRIGLECQPDLAVEGQDRDQMVQNITGILVENAEMLDEYFSLRIDTNTCTLESIPSILPPSLAAAPSESDTPSSHRDTSTISLERLPTLLARLGPMVDWDDEKTCFETFARELAFASIPDVGLSPPEMEQQQLDAEAQRDNQQRRQQATWQIQHRWFASMAKGVANFCPPKSLLERDVLQVANLPDLYRVFERC